MMRWPGTILLLLGLLAASDTRFAAPADLARGEVSGISSMDAGDIDGDGRADVVVLEGGKHAAGRTAFHWYRSPANPQDPWRRFEINPRAPLRAFLGAAQLADMDGDTDLDLVVSSDNHSGEVMAADVYVFLNPGPAALSSQAWQFYKINEAVLLLHHINDMQIADMDQDGKPDVIVRSLEPNQIHIFFQNAEPSYAHKILNTGIERSEGLAVGLIDADTIPDITFTGFWLQAPADPRNQEYIRHPIDAAYHLSNQNTKEALGDIDGDGKMDVVIGPAESYRDGGPADLAWYKNPGAGYNSDWEKHTLQPGVNDHHTIKIGDMDNDGTLDVVAGVPWHEQRIQVYYNGGTGDFSDPHTIHAGKGLYSGVLFDIEADGDLDIIGQDTYARESHPWFYENMLIDR